MQVVDGGVDTIRPAGPGTFLTDETEPVDLGFFYDLTVLSQQTAVRLSNRDLLPVTFLNANHIDPEQQCLRAGGQRWGIALLDGFEGLDVYAGRTRY